MKPTDDLFIEPEEDSYDFRERYQKAADGYRRYAVLHTALEMGLFGHMKDWKRPEDLANSGFDPEITSLVCGILCDMGFLDEENGKYRNTNGTSYYMDPSSPLYLGRTFRMIDEGLESFSDLSKAIKNGNVEPKPDENRFLRSMTAFGDFSKGGFIRELMDYMGKLEFPDGTSILDVAGGHGLYSVAIKSTCPSCNVTYFDRFEGAEVARRFFRSYEADIPIVVGDYYKGDIPGVYDVLVSSFNDSACKPELVPKLHSAVRPGGLVILRRYYITVTDPLERTLQTNIHRPCDKPVSKGPRGQSPEEYAEFEKAMSVNGFILEDRQTKTNGTQISLYKRMF